jgi:hypothetical protein
MLIGAGISAASVLATLLSTKFANHKKVIPEMGASRESRIVTV